MSITTVFLVKGTEPENQVINYRIKKLKACLLYKIHSESILVH